MPLENCQITLHAGAHDRHDCPVCFSLPTSLPEGSWQLNDGKGIIRPLQRLGGKDVALLEPALLAGRSRSYHLEPSPAPSESAVTLLDDPANGILHLQQQGQPVTSYHYRNVPARPYFHPLLTKNGVPLTRSYPMNQEVANEAHDHPHHRSLWIAFGDVNGVDNWSEEPGHGHTEHQEFVSRESGPVFGRFATTDLWTDSDSKPVLTQHLAVTLWATEGSVRLLDFSIRLESTHGDVFFGDTKEGGILSVRVASALDVPRGGRIENVYGGIDEAETWGKAAHWCDYSGIKNEQPVGIAVLDHPLSFRSPTHWHVRNYGLMTANPFGYAAYTNGIKEGSHLLSAGQTLSFAYRVVLHTGNAMEGQVNSHYLNFALPPKVQIVT